MGSKLEACAECTLKCLLDHGNKKKASPVVASFFKIMIGDQLSKVLFLPPKFSPTVLALVNQKAVLEDSRGRQWKVTISRVDGSLSFQQGWNAFALDHDLQVGEFLIFNYVMDSHFTVKIYDKSGCEKLKFPEAIHWKKWTWDNRNSTVKDGPRHTVDNSLINKQDSSTSVAFDADEDIGQHLYEMNAKGKAPMVMVNASNCDNSHERSKLKPKEPGGNIGQHLYEMNDKGKATIVTENASNYDDSNEMSKLKPKEEYIEDIICMIDRELGDKQEDRSGIYDLLNFEMLELSSGTGGSNGVVILDETCLHHDDSSVRLRNEAGSVDKNPVAKEAVAAAFPMNETYSPHDDLSVRLRNEAGSVDKNPVAKEVVAAAFPMDETYSPYDDSSVRLRNEAGSVDKSPVAKEAVAAAIPMDETYSHHEDSSLRLRNEVGSVDKSLVAKEDETYTHLDDSSLRLRNEGSSVDKITVAKETAALSMDETCSHHDDSSLRLRSEASLVDKAPLAREAVTTAIPSDASKFDGTEKYNSSEAKVKKLSPSDEDSRAHNKTSRHRFPTAAVNPNDTGSISNIVNNIIELLYADGSGNKVAASKKEHDLIDDSLQKANKNVTGTLESFDTPMKVVKTESVDLTSDLRFQKIIPEIDGKTFEPVDAVCSQISNMIKSEKDIAFPVPVVKSEPVGQVETFPRLSFSCLVAVGSQSFLELPVRLPIRMTIRGRHTSDRRVIFLRDPTMRLWPVLYIDNNFFKILSSGWEAFSKANNIQPGDTCAIGIEDASERICSVHISRS